MTSINEHCKFLDENQDYQYVEHRADPIFKLHKRIVALGDQAAGHRANLWKLASPFAIFPDGRIELRVAPENIVKGKDLIDAAEKAEGEAARLQGLLGEMDLLFAGSGAKYPLLHALALEKRQLENAIASTEAGPNNYAGKILIQNKGYSPQQAAADPEYQRQVKEIEPKITAWKSRISESDVFTGKIKSVLNQA
jgi:hypothetical protein